MRTECSLYAWVHFGLGQEEKCYLPTMLRRWVCPSGRWWDTRVLGRRVGQTPQEADLRAVRLGRASGGRILKWERERREFTWNKGARQSLQVEQRNWTHKVLEEEQPGDTKTYLNVWNKKSSHTILDVSFPTRRGWQALCSVGAAWVLPCQGKCPHVHANQVVPAWTSLSPSDLVPG